MGKEKLSLSAIHLVHDGRIEAAFDMELLKVAQDIEDRGADGIARRVTLDVVITPKVHAGSVEEVETEFIVKTTMPPRRSRPYSMVPQGGRQFIFNPESREDARQGTLDEAASARHSEGAEDDGE